MFYTPKPRQFSYKPRFYDPEKERWEALKQKYADERMMRDLEAELMESDHEVQEVQMDTADTTDADLAYFQRRVREVESREREKQRGLTWKDLFRKREMPTFNYTPRFSGSTDSDPAEVTKQGIGEHINNFKQRNVKIKRRFDISDTEYMKPIPATRIMLYALLASLLIYWIVF